MGRLSIGVFTGLVAMVLVMLLIFFNGGANVSTSRPTTTGAVTYGGEWLLLDILGAVGEELYGRATVILVAERFVGWKGAILVSGLMFSVFHLSNPGASPIWLLRLFAQGCLLAYAVYWTRSFWWSVGYHAGWNWVSAPLFGAAGSGYLDEGHIFDFTPMGNVWVTGGAIGPEGSAFAFFGMLVALGFLIFIARRKPLRHRAGEFC